MTHCIADLVEDAPRERFTRALWSWPRNILVASHGSRAADAAMIAAGEIAERASSAVQIVVANVSRGEATKVLRTVHDQRRRLVRQPSSWPLSFDVGDPASVVLRVSRTVRADLVVLGLGRASPHERQRGGKASQFAARYVDVPLYAAAEGCAPPTRCVIALPGGNPHMPTLRAALACVAPGAHVSVAVPDHAPSGDTFEALEQTPISGDFVTGVVRLAEAQNVHLIAVPICGTPGPVRSFPPNIAELLLLSARCSVLVVPG